MVFLEAFIGSILIAAAIGKQWAKPEGKNALVVFLKDAGLPPRVARLVRISSPTVEGLVGFMLLASIYPVIAALAAASISGIFLLMQSRALMRRSTVNCNCFGRLDSRTGHVVGGGRSLLILASSVALLVIVLRPGSERALDTTYRVSQFILGVAAGMGMILATMIMSAVFEFVQWRRGGTVQQARGFIALGGDGRR